MKNVAIFGLAIVLLMFSCSKDVSPSSSDNSSTGEGGSMAAMTIVGNYMYRIAGGNTIEVYDISGDSTAKLVASVAAGNGLETVFPYKQNLLIGTSNGMLIYDISNGANPTYVSTYTHVVSCDPVVAQGNYAYVTLRNGNRCTRGLTQLEVIDISNLGNPTLVKTVPMVMPHGLDADGKNLIVGEGTYGFKWFDISNPTNPTEILFNKTVPGYDIISRGNSFILVGDKGLYQYEYGNKTLNLLSTIPVARP